MIFMAIIFSATAIIMLIIGSGGMFAGSHYPPLSRQGFMIRFWPTLLVYPAGAALFLYAGPHEYRPVFTLFIAALFAWCAAVSERRLRDAGMPRLLAPFVVFPPIGFVLAVFLSLRGSQPGKPPNAHP